MCCIDSSTCADVWWSPHDPQFPGSQMQLTVPSLPPAASVEGSLQGSTQLCLFFLGEDFRLPSPGTGRQILLFYFCP